MSQQKKPEFQIIQNAFRAVIAKAKTRHQRSNGRRENP
jgi:hypothetical protein